MSVKNKSKVSCLKRFNFKDFLEKNGYLLCAFIIPVAIFFMVFVAVKVWPFGKNSVLVLDLNGQYVYFFEALRDAVLDGGSLIYSWARSLGGEFTGIYAYYLASPLSYIVCLFPKGAITEALLTILLIKCGISGATMAFYLKNTKKNLNEITAIIFGVMYALSSYAIVYSHNTMWIDALMLFPLVIYGEEKLIKEHKYALFITTLALTILSNFYIGYMVCIFVALYYFYYTLISYGKTDYNPTGEKNHLLRSLLRIAGASAVAVAISAIIILPTYYSLKFGKSDFTDPSWTVTTQFDLFDFFIKLFPGAYDTVRPEGLPWVYAGMLTTMLVPLYFACKKVSIREKMAAAALIFVMVASMNINVLDLVWHGFQRPNWLNFRYSFMLIFFMVVLAAKVIEEIKSFKFTHFVISGIGCIAVILIAQKLDYSFLDNLTCVWFSIIVICALLLALYSLINENLKGYSMTLLAVVISVEMFVASIVSINALDADVVFSDRHTYTDYMDMLTPSVEMVKESDPSFYRMEKFIYDKYQADGKNHLIVQRKVCDNFALDIYGISSSSSTLNASVIKYLNQMGYASHSHWSSYIGGNPVSDALLGMKYIMYKSGDKYVSNILEEYNNDSENGIQTFINPYALSMAYAASADYKYDFDIDSYASPFEMTNAMITSILGEDETVEVFKPLTTTLEYSGSKITYEGPVYETIIDENGKEQKISIPYIFYGPEKLGNPAQLKYTFTIPEDAQSGGAYFFLCSNYPQSVNWYLIGDTDNYGSFFENESDCIQALGNLTPGKSYTVIITLSSEQQLLYLCKEEQIFYYIDAEVYSSVFERLAKGNFIIDKEYSPTHLTGKINVADDQSCVYTSIPYDEGWQVYVDGKKTEIYRADGALLSFDITPGEHELEFKYSCKYYNFGAILSVLGLITFAGVIFIDNKFFKKKRLELIAENADLIRSVEENEATSTNEEEKEPSQS